MNVITGFQRQALLLDLIAKLRAAGSWTGKTHVQKCCYFLQQGLGVPLGLEYFLYKHGPFSFELRDLIGEMRADLLLDVEPCPPYGGSLTVTDSGSRLMAGFPSTREQFRDHLEFVVDTLKEKGVAELERLGTALYVLAEQPGRSVNELAVRIHAVKPHVAESSALEAVLEVQEVLSQAPKE